MEKFTLVIILSVIILLVVYLFGQKIGRWKTTLDNKSTGVIMFDNKTVAPEIYVVYDNNEYDSKLKIGWGFSCLVKLKDKNILFDTGGDSPTLLNNMEKLGIDLQKIDIIVLSHIHGDHVGGLSGMLKTNPNVTVYIPKSFPSSFKDEIKSYGADYVDVSSAAEIFDGVYTTGEMGTWIKEQSLIIKTEKGIVVITGCAHPGIVYIVKKSKELTKDRVYLVLGGFHLSGASDADLRQIINAFKDMDVKKVGPCHCSGDRCRELFEEEYGNDFVEIGVEELSKYK